VWICSREVGDRYGSKSLPERERTIITLTQDQSYGCATPRLENLSHRESRIG